MNDGKRDQAGVTADVSADVIQAALESVESGSAKSAGSPEVPDAVGTIELDLPEPAADAGAVPSNAAHEKAIQELQAQLDLSVERARETLDRLKDTHERYLRAAADLENYKKRALREKEEAERYGVQRLLKDLLPVVDNLERALSHAEASNPLTDGIQATRRIFEDTLGRYGVKGFSAVGQAFDPNRHEAMQQIETSDSPPGMVVSEMVRGFTLHDRLIRPALVAVSAAPSVVAPVPAAVEASPAAPAATEVPPAQPEGGKVS